ncbi:MAG TPA: hypothetical protein VHJ76_08240 [Actinomycetota bacterium]|nr:hypothetical protein [Actinomycetota bacterium]
MRRAAAGCLLLLALPACFFFREHDDDPVLGLEIPDTASPGEVVTAELTVENPGPEEMRNVVVAFATVGVAAASGPIPNELVPVTTTADNPAVESVEPSPSSVSDDGVVYVFGGLDAGEETTITFELRVPEQPGPAANSLSVYEGDDTERISGLLLQTVVRE